jgi:hypothetical protein
MGVAKRARGGDQGDVRVYESFLGSPRTLRSWTVMSSDDRPSVPSGSRSGSSGSPTRSTGNAKSTMHETSVHPRDGVTGTGDSPRSRSALRCHDSSEPGQPAHRENNSTDGHSWGTARYRSPIAACATIAYGRRTKRGDNIVKRHFIAEH